MEQQEQFDQWAIVELMGHRKLAGRVSERIIAGQPLLQIDVPEVSQNGTQLAGYTQFYGASSLYCLTPTTEEIVRRYTLYHRERPVQSYELPQLQAAEATPTYRGEATLEAWERTHSTVVPGQDESEEV